MEINRIRDELYRGTCIWREEQKSLREKFQFFSFWGEGGRGEIGKKNCLNVSRLDSSIS